MLRRAQIILSVMFVALLGIATNIATGVLPSSWQGRLWVAWPLLIVILIAAAVLEVSQKDEPSPDFPSHQARDELLRRVRRFWVTGVLEKSLYNEARIELDLVVEDSTDRPFDITVTWSNGTREQLPPGTGMAEVFARMDRRIVILGDPGAGKTTMLLELAKALLSEAGNETDPVPVVLPLASWARQRRSIGEWIVDELVESYGMPRRLAGDWLRAHQILPLFDGLDEVALEHRKACVSALNRYLHENPTSSAVCCRSQEYRLLEGGIKFHGMVTIQRLSPAQTERFLAAAGPGLDGLKAALTSDPELRQLADSPLLLSIMALAYRDGPETTSANRSAGPRHRLYAQYVSTMLRWRKNRLYPPDKSHRYLKLLAHRLQSDRQTVFTLDLLGTNWAFTGRRFSNTWYIMALAAIPACAVMFLTSQVLAGTTVAFIATTALGIALIIQMSSEDYEDAAGISWRSQENQRNSVDIIRPPRELPVRGDITSNSVMKSFIMTVRGFLDSGQRDKIAALPITIGVGVSLSVHEKAPAGPVYAIALFVFYVLVSGMIDGLMFELANSGRTIFRRSEVPSPALRPRVRLALRVGSAWGLMTGFLTSYIASAAPAESVAPGNYGVLLGTAAFLLTFVSIGGGPLVEQWILRSNLARHDRVPWPCLPFLDFMTECLILRQVGHGYIFVHRELLDFLAQNHREDAPRSVLPDRRTRTDPR
ncbi:NACHT domain-containing protein [Actinocorallia herbida]|nr:NACHT domain-containing protein [Actinocorallia herbida]